jgi:HTH-type transcriptional regulator/antitoxin HigA
MRIKPIKSEGDYEEALEEISGLFAAPAGTDDHDRLDVLSTLVEAYEAKQHPILPPDPIAAIEYEAEKRGLSRKELTKLIGPSGRVSEVLSKRRPLSITQIRKLHDTLGIPADVLITPYPTGVGRATTTTDPARKPKLSRAPRMK